MNIVELSSLLTFIPPAVWLLQYFVYCIRSFMLWTSSNIFAISTPPDLVPIVRTGQPGLGQMSPNASRRVFRRYSWRSLEAEMAEIQADYTIMTHHSAELQHITLSCDGGAFWWCNYSWSDECCCFSGCQWSVLWKGRSYLTYLLVYGRTESGNSPWSMSLFGERERERGAGGRVKCEEVKQSSLEATFQSSEDFCSLKLFKNYFSI